MEERDFKLQRFFTACDELVEGKYVVADTKISETLRAIANCKELTELFAGVTTGFDYAAAKRDCLRFPVAKGSAHGAAYLPAERTDILAFVFCLLVEIDGGSVRLSDFLLRYFYEDGSYTASYALFVGRMIRPFRDIVRDLFPDMGRRGALERLHRERDGVLEKISARASVERSNLASVNLTKTDRAAAEVLLSELFAAIGRRDAVEVNAVLTGYRYFLFATGAPQENAAVMFSLAEELKK